MHWIKEVESVDSVDDLIFSSSVRGIQMPNSEVLDAIIASALNRIIHNSHADLFTVTRRNEDILEFDSKWDGILL